MTHGSRPFEALDTGSSQHEPILTSAPIASQQVAGDPRHSGCHFLHSPFRLHTSTYWPGCKRSTDGLLKAAAVSILEKVGISDGALFFDLPYDTFTILGSIGEDRIFYRIDANSTFLTGYEDLPISDTYGDERTPAFASIEYRGGILRLAAIEKPVLVEGQSIRIRVLIGQTSNFQAQLLSQLTENLLIIVLSFCLFVGLLALLTVNSMLNPIRRLADAVDRRGPNDLRQVDHPTPQELEPLLNALNDFISRLNGALKQTEIFIAEAAHHIRTPLATVKSEGELALRKARKPENRAHLRNIVRSVEQANRSATQLLDHAVVLYRMEQPERRTINCSNALTTWFQTLHQRPSCVTSKLK